MTDSAFDYDVAISFLADDEGVAREIAIALASQKTFVYADR